MLPDLERKILRILWSQNRVEWFKLNLNHLCLLSQRRPDQVKAAMKNLIAQRYVELDNDMLRVSQPWEPEPGKEPTTDNGKYRHPSFYN